ncbi:MAG: protein-disulfide reductase DsbD domain-containing protein [Planctomycetota bacterium]|jgi:thiol:disulfide interchange protein DsbD
MRYPSAFILIAVTAALLPVAAARAQFGLGGDRAKAEDLVQVRLLADVDRIAPGRTFHLVFVFDIAPQWHIYWKNPGVSGLPPDVQVTAPEGFEIGRPRFTRPREINGPDGLNYGYEGRGAMFVPVTAPAAPASTSARFAARVSYLVCKRACLLGETRCTLSLDVSEVGGEPAPSADEVVAAQRSRLPRRLTEKGDAMVSFDGQVLRVTGPAADGARLTFFPAPMPGVVFGAPSSHVAGGRFEMTVPVEVRPADALGEPIRVEGLVTLGTRPDDPSYEFEVPLATSPR